MFKLVIQDDEGKTTVVPFVRDELTIGRKEGNTIRLTERNVSRRHARVLRSNGSITIEDLDSYNGIRVNGARIQGRATLKESDRVQIGDYLIEVRSEDSEKASSDATQPIERVDPMGTTPVPEITSAKTVKTPAIPSDAGGFTAAAEPEVDEAVTTKAPQLAGNSKLVVLSTNFAGREYELDKASMVIGRTDDNDVWINHRSISRHHAKIVRENGRYSIVDLQSSNGVRVNGEEYGKVELRRADVIDLGHVRLRFVEAGEDFLFGRDAQAIDIAPQGGGKTIWVILALLVIGGGVAAFAMTRKGGDEGSKASKPNITQPDNGTKSVTPPPLPPDASPSALPPPDTDNVEVLKHLKDAEDALKAQRWAEAQGSAKQALELDPNSELAKVIEAKARAENAAQLVFDDVQKDVAKRKYKQALADRDKIPSDSYYRPKADEIIDQARDSYVAAEVSAAKPIAARGKCKELRARANRAGAVFPEAKDAIMALPCDKGGEVVTNNNNNNGNNGNNNPPPDNPPPDNPPPSATALINQAKAAAKASQFGKAIRLCEDALKVKKGDQEATMVCAIAACNLKSAGKAKKYISKLKSSQRAGMARQICLRNGVTLQ